MCPGGSTAVNTSAGTAGKSDLRSAFQIIDGDRDGRISKDDLRKFCAGLSEEDAAAVSAEDVVGTMMQVADTNRDGYVEYEEFERVLEERERERSGGVMEEAFRVMDTDGDGKVSQEDLRAYLKSAGFEAHDEDIKAMIRLGGADESDGVTFDGLLKILALGLLLNEQLTTTMVTMK